MQHGNQQRAESYSYAANLDHMVSASYGDGLANAGPAWSYDAAGNRSSDSTNAATWSYDNLNRILTSRREAISTTFWGTG